MSVWAASLLAFSYILFPYHNRISKQSSMCLWWQNKKVSLCKYFESFITASSSLLLQRGSVICSLTICICVGYPEIRAILAYCSETFTHPWSHEPQVWIDLPHSRTFTSLQPPASSFFWCQVLSWECVHLRSWIIQNKVSCCTVLVV